MATGKTTLMMLTAMRHAEDGPVMVIVAHEQHATQLRAIYRHKNLTIISADRAMKPEFRRGREKAIEFVDHYVYESQRKGESK